jgi:hypothetical protein
MNPNLVGSIYGRFSIKQGFFLPSFGSFGKAASPSEEKIF